LLAGDGGAQKINWASGRQSALYAGAVSPHSLSPGYQHRDVRLTCPRAQQGASDRRVSLALLLRVPVSPGATDTGPVVDVVDLLVLHNAGHWLARRAATEQDGKWRQP
jgi:hypothetical protein